MNSLDRRLRQQKLAQLKKDLFIGVVVIGIAAVLIWGI